MKFKVLVLGLAVVIGAGCRTSGPGIHMIPVTRDYARLEKVSLDDASRAVHEAHQRGAAASAPYQYASALHYLAIARDQARAGDRRAMRDYAALAKQMSQEALRMCPAERGEPERAVPSRSYEDSLARFEAVKARYDNLDREKAVEVAPVVYAHLTATLSRAEHALKFRPNWRRAEKMLDIVQADIETVLRQDSDDDGVPDMRDPAPAEAEDVDGFEDQDGAPDNDNDRDGIPDQTDLRPREPETVNGYKDHDGAPDRLPLLEAISFRPGSSELSGEAEGYLRGIKILLLEWPDLRLRVAGHGNPAGAETKTMDLSRMRAENVRRFLLSEGVPESQLVVTFLGASEPVADPATSAGRAANARVELELE